MNSCELGCASCSVLLGVPQTIRPFFFFNFYNTGEMKHGDRIIIPFDLNTVLHSAFLGGICDWLTGTLTTASYLLNSCILCEEMFCFFCFVLEGVCFFKAYEHRISKMVKRLLRKTSKVLYTIIWWLKDTWKQGVVKW